MIKNTNYLRDIVFTSTSCSSWFTFENLSPSLVTRSTVEVIEIPGGVAMFLPVGLGRNDLDCSSKLSMGLI